MKQSGPTRAPGAAPHVPFVPSGSYPAREGNAVSPLIDGVPAFRRIGQAVEAARRSVWVVIAFIEPDFRMPDGLGSLFDLLDRAVGRGLDVRVLIWRPTPEGMGFGPTFSGTGEHLAMLQQRGSRFRIRWDRHEGTGCHHQKCWLIDASEPSEVAFVGGMNLSRGAYGTRGHLGADAQFHDLYVELSGPSASDVHHNFVQRWNDASDRAAADGSWGHTGGDELPIPARVSSPRGDAVVQVQRTIMAGRHRDLPDGEQSIFRQYLVAIEAARRTIYLEHQALPVVEIAAKLEAALARGVEVVLLAPPEPEAIVRVRRKDAAWDAFFERIEALSRHDGFAMAGLAAPDGAGGRRSVSVHSKAMLIDDAWATIGSCNLHAGSLFRNTEMNVSFWDPASVRALRCELMAEHLGEETRQLDDREAFARFRRIARGNAAKRKAGDGAWQGLAFALDPAVYGK